MHACPACGDACDCQDDDLVEAGLRDCRHICEDELKGEEPDVDEDDFGVGE